MVDTIELINSNNGFKGGPLGNHIVLYVGETSVKYPNILVKSPNELPKILLSNGAVKGIKAQVHINRTSSSNISEEDTKVLANKIAGQMRMKGFLNCTYKVNFIHSSPKVMAEGKSASAMISRMGANAYSSGNEVHFGNATPAQKLLGHELTHVVQQ